MKLRNILPVAPLPPKVVPVESPAGSELSPYDVPEPLMPVNVILPSPVVVISSLYIIIMPL